MNPLIKLFLCVIILYTIYHFIGDFYNAWKNGGSFIEGMNNSTPSTKNIKDKANNIIKNTDDIYKVLPDDIVINKNKLKTTISSSKTDLALAMASAKPHALNAFKDAQPDLMLAKPHLDSAKPHLKNAFVKAMPHLTKAHIEVQPHLNGAMNKLTPLLKEIIKDSKNASMPPKQTNKPNTPTNFSILPNGTILLPPEGVTGETKCPNQCKQPVYDNTSCENMLFNGKEYRKCPWIKPGIDNVLDCASCGAVLLPKNQFGYAKTNIGFTDLKSIKHVASSVKSKKATKGDMYNIGKEFLRQHSEFKGYKLPENITTDQYTLVGKLLFIYLSNTNNNFNKQRLKSYIEALYIENYINKCDDSDNNSKKGNNNSKKGDNNSKKGNNNYKKVFNIDKLNQTNAYAYAKGLEEASNDNGVGGSKTQYKNKTAYTTQYKPVDPRKKPSPYNSIWKMFSV